MHRDRAGGSLTAVAALALFSGVAGCDDTTCGSGCPKLGAPATDDDVRLVLSENDALGGLEMDGEFFAGALGGELVLRPERSVCFASSDNPCHYTLIRLEVRLDGFATEKMSDVRLAVKAPLEIDDYGNGLILNEGTIVQSCVEAGGEKQHGSAPTKTTTFVLYDRLANAASIQAEWPLVFSDSEADCRERTGSLIIEGRFQTAQ